MIPRDPYVAATGKADHLPPVELREVREADPGRARIAALPDLLGQGL
jgi:hypothetical protein